MELNTSNISRKKFLHTCRSVLAVGSIAGVSTVALVKSIKKSASEDEYIDNEAPMIDAPYKLTTSFGVDGDINGFELWEDKLIVATQNKVQMFTSSGDLLNSFAIGGDLRDITVYNDHIFMLFPKRVEVCYLDGESICKWEAYSDNSDYCSFAVASGSVFVTDAANKEICKYSADGNFIKTIKSPNRFIIPSYTFGIICMDGVVYCSNSGRHQIEMFTPDGDYLGAFGQAGAQAGSFCGCCNPVHLTVAPDGNIITSEKGIPRISYYGKDGQFHNILLDSRALGGGNKAYDVKILNDKLFVAGKNKVSTFQYNV